MDFQALIAQVLDIIAKAKAATTWQDKIAVALLVGQVILDLVKHLQTVPQPSGPVMMAAGPTDTFDDCCNTLEAACIANQGMAAAPEGGGALILILVPLIAKLLEKLLSK